MAKLSYGQKYSLKQYSNLRDIFCENFSLISYNLSATNVQNEKDFTTRFTVEHSAGFCCC
jgi:hypothetical protein